MKKRLYRILNTFPLFAAKRLISTNKKCLEKEAALYVHWPFCAKLCPYCDFNKYIRRNVDENSMIKSLQKELKYFIQFYGIQRIKSVYFGGGTPSLALPHLVSTILETIEHHSKLLDYSEITLEVNPTSIESEKLRSFQEHGITRVSIGIQALNNDDLKVLGRQHTKEQALKCLEEAKNLFNTNVSVDLMFGRPNQTHDQWINELNEVVDLDCHHVSLYQLTMKKFTPMERKYRKGLLKLPSDDCLADMYESTVQILKQHNLQRYEVSNFSLKGYQSKHNLCYWNGDDYIGIGPGAHGRLRTVQVDEKSNENFRHALLQAIIPQQWLKKVMDKGHGIQEQKILSLQENIEEMILLGLRTTQGIPKKRFEDMAQTTFEVLQNNSSLRDLIEGEFVFIDEKSIRASEEGFLFLDSITRDVIYALNIPS